MIRIGIDLDNTIINYEKPFLFSINKKKFFNLKINKFEKNRLKKKN